jgi:hypothetical protein
MISRSPLILGSYLPDLRDTVLKMITNPEVIAVDQNSSGNRQLFKRNGTAAWIADDPSTGGKYIALFNLQDKSDTVILNPDSVNMSGRFMVRDLWKRKDLGIFGKELKISIEPHGAEMYRLVNSK